jgi:hypothetical protein
MAIARRGRRRFDAQHVTLSQQTQDRKDRPLSAQVPDTSNGAKVTDSVANQAPLAAASGFRRAQCRVLLATMFCYLLLRAGARPTGRPGICTPAS